MTETCRMADPIDVSHSLLSGRIGRQWVKAVVLGTRTPPDRPIPSTVRINQRRWGFALLAYAFAAVWRGRPYRRRCMSCISQRMHFAVLTISVIYATCAGGVLVALLVYGRWSDAVGRRPMLLAGNVCALTSAVVFLGADPFAMLVIARVASGLSVGLFTGTATAAVIEAVPPAWRTRAAAVATVAYIGGLGARPLLAGVLVQYGPAPLRLSFVMHIALVMLTAAAVLVRTGDVRARRKHWPAATLSTGRRSPPHHQV